MDEIIEKYGKTCYTCNRCCCDTENENDPKARFWCEELQLTMSLAGICIADCGNWEIVNKEKEFKFY